MAEEPEIIETEENPKLKKEKSFSKGILVGALGALALVLVIGIVTVLVLTRSGSGVLDTATKLKINGLTRLIEKYYYKDVDTEDLQNGLYAGLLEGLDDPYSCYYTAEEYEELSQSLSGNYSGIGATLTMSTDKVVTVVSVFDGSPAQEAGLQAGDQILSADDFLATEASDISEFVTHVKGEEGTKVSLQVVRDGETQTIEITRKTLEYPTVAYQMLDDNVGYVEISSFTDTTKDQFDEAMADLESQGMESVIFDLRSNGGGLLDSVVDIVDEIIPEGTIVYTLDKDGNREDYTSSGDSYMTYPIVVLTSGNTASAAEIFTAAIQDYDYGTILGTTTFGKGIVQSTIPLNDGSALKLTTSSYYTPKGVCIQGEGIDPDVELEYEFLGGEDDSYSIEFDNQIQKALEILKNKTQVSLPTANFDRG